ncbi:MAG TPA: SUF system NifU family Fe-S cluster assembly protein [Acetobacteraceae bacterium]
MFDDVRDLYSAAIIERGRRPRHMRRLEAFDATARGDNPMCGDRVQVWVKYGPRGAIAETGFDARGCEICKASADLMVEAVGGRTPEQTRALFAEFSSMARTGEAPPEVPDSLRPLANVHEYPSRIKCATLAWTALVAALDGKGEATSE